MFDSRHAGWRCFLISSTLTWVGRGTRSGGRISVGVYDQHEIFAAGAAAILGDDPQVSSVSRNIADAPELDVAVTSLGFVGHESLDCPIILCASADEVAPASAVTEQLAALFMRSEVTPDQLCGAVHAAAAGLRLNWQAAERNTMDDRAREVLRLLARGASTREISTELGYSERTIKAVIQQVEQTLGARSRAHAVALAMRGALI